MTHAVSLRRRRAGRPPREQQHQPRRARRHRLLHAGAPRQAWSRDVVDKTMILFDAVQPPAGEMPVVLAAGAAGILLHEAIGHGMEADFNRKNVSIYSDKIGKPVAKPFVSIVDEGTQEGARGAINVDDEGNAVGTHDARRERHAHELPARLDLREALRREADRQRTPPGLRVRADAAHALDVHAPRPAQARRDHRVGEEGHLLRATSRTARSTSAPATSRST